MPTKAPTKKQTIEDLERKEMLAEATKLSAEADLLVLQAKREQLAVKRAAVSVKSAGGKTPAILALEECDKEDQALERSVTLAEAAISEAEVDLQAARNALATAQAEAQEKRVRAAAEASHRARLEFEECLDALVQAKKQVMQTELDYQRVARSAGVETPWIDLDGRMGHRVFNRLKRPAPTPAWGIAPAPALAKRSGDDDAS